MAQRVVIQPPNEETIRLDIITGMTEFIRS
jgi:hypothetical protein